MTRLERKYNAIMNFIKTNKLETVYIEFGCVTAILEDMTYNPYEQTLELKTRLYDNVEYHTYNHYDIGHIFDIKIDRKYKVLEFLTFRAY